MGSAIEFVEFVSRNPSGYFCALPQVQLRNQPLDARRVESAHARQNQTHFRVASSIFGESPHQQFDVLVGMQSRDAKQVSPRLRAFAFSRQIKESLIHTVRRDDGVLLKIVEDVVAGGFGWRQEKFRFPNCRPYQEPPKHQIHWFEELRMALVLKVVNGCYLRARGEQRRRKTRVEQYIQLVTNRRKGQHCLLPKDPGRPERRLYGMLQEPEIRRYRDKVRSGPGIGDDQVFVGCVDLRQRD